MCPTESQPDRREVDGGALTHQAPCAADTGRVLAMAEQPDWVLGASQAGERTENPPKARGAVNKASKSPPLLLLLLLLLLLPLGCRMAARA